MMSSDCPLLFVIVHLCLGCKFCFLETRAVFHSGHTIILPLLSVKLLLLLILLLCFVATTLMLFSVCMD